MGPCWLRTLVGVVVVFVVAQGCTDGGSSRAPGSASATAVAPVSVPSPTEDRGTVSSTAPVAPAAPATSPPTSAVTSSGVGALVVTVSPFVLPTVVYRTQEPAVGGWVYVLGGIDAAGVTVAGVDRVDPSTGAVTHAGALATPTHGAAALTFGCRVLVFGGAATSVHTTVQAFDPATGRTSVIGSGPGPLADLTAAAVGNQMLLLGGFNGARGLDTVLSTTDATSFHVVGHLAQALRYPAGTTGLPQTPPPVGLARVDGHSCAAGQ